MTAPLPSPSALAAAAARAAHLVVDQPPFILQDTFAMTLLGDRGEELVAFHRSHPAHVAMAGNRYLATARSRAAEVRLARAIERGVAQYVILGAGLDTFAYRSRLSRYVRIFEVDQPHTQAWKRQQIEHAHRAPSDRVTFVSATLAKDDLALALAHAGFKNTEPAFVSWLGATMSLTQESVAQMACVLGAFASGTELVVDALLPPGWRDAVGQAYAGYAMPVAERNGEPWLSTFTPFEMQSALEDAGWSVVEQLEQRDWIDPPLWNRSDVLTPFQLWMLAHAKRI